MSILGGFGQLNKYRKSLHVLQAPTADALLGQIRQISQPIHIIHMYSAGSRHFAWIEGDIIIKKQNNRSNANG